MELDGSLPCSEEPATGSCHGPVESSSHIPEPYSSSHIYCSDFLNKIVYTFLTTFMRATCPANLTFIDLNILIVSDKQYKLWKGKSYS
jgi:hypothetical protein